MANIGVYGGKYACHYFTLYNRKYYVGLNGSEYGYSNWTTGNHTLIFNGDNNMVKLDQEVFYEGRESATADVNLWIGNREGAACFQGKIYYIKITDKSTGEIVRDMKLCYRKSDNVIGFYDIINGEFYTRQGTGEFDKGNDVCYELMTPSTQLITDAEHTLYAIWR